MSAAPPLYSTPSTSCFSSCTPCISAKLGLSRVAEDVNCLSISFSSSPREEIEELSAVKFYFQPAATVPAISQELYARESFRVVDVYPLNGVTKSRAFKITDFMQKPHRKQIGQMVEILNEVDPEKKSVRCLVVDFKDISCRYDRLEEISAAERKFAAFFQGDLPKATVVQRTIQELIRNNEINFFINEGSLKATLIRDIFDSAQGSFLQEKGEGPKLFCQLCEVIMNGFKQGYEVVVNGSYFRPDDYITVIDERLIERIDSAKQRLSLIPRLMTLYPEHYRETYSPFSEYYQLITTIFKVNHFYENETTIITID